MLFAREKKEAVRVAGSATGVSDAPPEGGFFGAVLRVGDGGGLDGRSFHLQLVSDREDPLTAPS